MGCRSPGFSFGLIAAGAGVFAAGIYIERRSKLDDEPTAEAPRAG